MARRYLMNTSPVTVTDLAGNPLPLAQQERLTLKLTRRLGFKIPGRPRKHPGTTVAEMRYLPLQARGLSHSEIGELTGRTTGAVKKALYRLRRAEKRLAERVDKK